VCYNLLYRDNERKAAKQLEPNCPPNSPPAPVKTNEFQNGNKRFRGRFGLTLLIIGFIIFIIGAKPEIFGLNRGVSIGFVQIIVILLGLGVLTLGGSLALLSLWGKNHKSLLADFGTRTIATGYVICFFTALADAFGFGTNPMPNVFLGRLQSQGLIIGMVIIGIGFLMLLPYRPAQQ